MYKKLSCVVLMAMCLTTFTYFGVFPANYESQTAQQKLDFLMKQVTAGQGSYMYWPSLAEQVPLVAPVILGGQDLKPVGWHNEDQVPQGRKKLIHTAGWTCSIKFDMKKGNKYTGGFQGGIGVARFSAAKKPASMNNTPGLSIKVLRDKVPSHNHMAMYKLVGQQDTDNYFDKPFSNHVSELPGFSLDPNVIQLKALVGKFKQQDPSPARVGLTTLAKTNTDGSPVANPKSPYQLIYQPNPTLKNRCASQKDFDQYGFYKCFDTIKSGDKLYKIFAIEKPMSGNNATASALEHIGYLVATSQMYRSKFMDSEVHFKHTFWTEEVDSVGDMSWKPIQQNAGAEMWKNVVEGIAW